MSRGLRIVAIALVLAGVFFRFWHLDAKLFSYDEATTSIRAGGHTLADYYRDAFDGRTATNASFSRYQHAGAESDARAVVASLAIEDPQHPPLYYVLEHAWSQHFGNAVATRRQISAIAGSAALFAAVWLGAELTGALAAGLLFAALLAVSPFFVIYAQQAREYSLWELCTLVASALLVRALRRGTVLAWCGYALATACGLYADLLFVYVLAGHAAYVAITIVAEGRARRVVPFLISAGAAVAAFAPWLVAVARGRALLTNNDYLSAAVPAKIFALKWIFNAGAVFFDLEDRTVVLAIVLVPLFALLIFAAAILLRSQPVRVWAFVVPLGIITAGALVVPDLAHHESRSTAARYLVPMWLAFELTLALFFARAFAQRRPRARAVAGVAFAAVVLCGLASVARDSSARTSWAEGKSIAGLAPIAQTIDRSADPLVVFINDPQRFDFAMLALSNELAPGTRMQQQNFGTPFHLSHAAGTVYLLDPTARVRDEIARSGIALRRVYADTDADAAPAAVRTLRLETARAREAHGLALDGLSLWTMEEQLHAAR